MELYHVLNRGVEKRDIFMDDSDRARFVHDLYEFNDASPANNDRRLSPMIEIRSQSFGDRRQIVDVHGWCLMRNHYHLLISERVEGGLSLFSRRLNVGYAMYFNEKHTHSGSLFQGRTKKILITNDSHFLHILNYIHFNPLDFLKDAGDWRRGNVCSSKRALEHLESHRWSSFLDYCGKKNFPSIITTELFGDKNYRRNIAKHLQELELDQIRPFLLE